MTTFVEAFAKVKKAGYVKYAGMKDLEAYVIAGDDGALKGLTSPGTWAWWISDLTSAMHEPPAWTEEDRRLIRALKKMKAEEYLWRWVADRLEREKADEDFVGMVRDTAGMKPEDAAMAMLKEVSKLMEAGKPTSAGRFLLGFDEKALAAIANAVDFTDGYRSSPEGFVELLVVHAPGKVDKVLPEVMKRSDDGDHISICERLLTHDRKRFEEFVRNTVNAKKDPYYRCFGMSKLFTFAPQRYHQEMLEATRQLLAQSSRNNNERFMCEWVVPKLGECPAPLN